MIKPAPFIIDKFLRMTGYGAITLPPFGIFILAERFNEEELRKHESIHWEQYQEMGLIKFYLLYLWYNIRYGYSNNSMEIEADTKSKM